MNITTHMYMCIYIYREREMYVCMCIYIYIYIYTYISSPGRFRRPAQQVLLLLYRKE